MTKEFHSPKVFYKFGYTTSRDAEVRFTNEYHDEYEFRNICLEDDYKPQCLWSAYVTKEDAIQMEANWKAQYPRDFYTGKFYNGITECRKLDEKQAKTIVKDLYAWKAKRTKAPFSGHKVYFMKFTKRKNDEESN